MGLFSTLAKVAVGVAIAKGASHVSRNGMPKLGGGAGGLAGGLGGMLEKLGANSTANHAGRAPHASGLNGLLAKAGPALTGLLGAGAATAATSPRNTAPAGLAPAGLAPAGLGPIFNQAIVGHETVEPTRDQELAAALMLRAMVQAVMADGKLDDAESEKLMRHLDSASDAERAYVTELLDKPVDVDALAFDVPDGMEEQVYLISLMAIDLDSRIEAQYLHDLAAALAIDHAAVNAIHQQAGLPALYA